MDTALNRRLTAPATSIPFLEFPTEVRLKIYEYIFAGGEFIFETHWTSSRVMVLIHIPPSVHILQTCRLCLLEALDLYYELTMYTCIGEGAWRILSKSFPVERIANLSGASAPSVHLADELERFTKLKTVNLLYSSFAPSRFLQRDGSPMDLTSYEAVKTQLRDKCLYLDKLAELRNSQGRVRVTVSLDILCDVGFDGKQRQCVLPVLIDVNERKIIRFQSRALTDRSYLSSKPLMSHARCETHHQLHKLYGPVVPVRDLLKSTTAPHHAAYHSATGLDIKVPGGIEGDSILVDEERADSAPRRERRLSKTTVSHGLFSRFSNFKSTVNKVQTYLRN